jgi:hypothetical protein
MKEKQGRVVGQPMDGRGKRLGALGGIVEDIRMRVVSGANIIRRAKWRLNDEALDR